MSSPSNILIIGGTRGIGLEFVRQTLSQNPSATVFATARDPTKATELQALAATSNNRVQILAADTTNADSLKAAAEKITSLDRIIYNAGVLSGWGNPLEVGINALKQNIDTNLYGAYFTAVYFAPLLLKSSYKNKSLVFLSSSFGSLALADEIKASHGVLGYDPSAFYNISKTALNRLGKELDQVFRPQGVPVLLIHPGLVKTEMNPWGNLTTSESVASMLKVVGGLSTEAKLFVNYNGDELPW